jgi:iron complex transport system substrate-binding protein
LIEAAPDVIVVPARGLATIGGEPGLLAMPGVRDTPAGRNRRIIAFDDLLLLGFGPRLPGAIEELSRLLRSPANAATH